jgi:hypothetical protein
MNTWIKESITGVTISDGFGRYTEKQVLHVSAISDGSFEYGANGWLPFEKQNKNKQKRQVQGQKECFKE